MWSLLPTRFSIFVLPSFIIFTLLQTLALEWPDEVKEEKKAKQKALRKALGQDSGDATSEDERRRRPRYGPLMEVT
jgi:hypothetical protein